jgi:regulatory protein
MTSAQEAQKKLYRYCAYQERCHQEVEAKLNEWGIYGDEADQVINHLIKEGFLNEERFAKAFAGGKFRLKGWGRLKIVRELEQRNLSRHCIRAGLAEIDDNIYIETLRKVLLKKMREESPGNVYSLRDKVARFAIQRGFEPALVWEQLREIIP